MKQSKVGRYTADEFLDSGYPFGVIRCQHLAKEYNEATLHQREFWKVVYVESGEGRKIINGHNYPFHAGSLFLIHPDDVTSYLIKTGSMTLYNVVFLPEFLGEGLSRLTNEYQFFSIFSRDFSASPLNTERLYVLNSDSRIKDIVFNMLHEYQKKPTNYRAMLQLMLMELLIRMGRKGIKSAQKHSRSNVVAYINHMIAVNYKNDFNLGLLAFELGIDKTNLCRLYKQASDTTIIQHLLDTRLREACLILLDGRRPISDACYECGFHDLSYFYRTFKKYCGVSPRQYRLQKGVSVQ